MNRKKFIVRHTLALPIAFWAFQLLLRFPTGDFLAAFSGSPLWYNLAVTAALALFGAAAGYVLWNRRNKQG